MTESTQDSAEPEAAPARRWRWRRWWLLPPALLLVLGIAVGVAANLESVRRAVLIRLLAQALQAEVELHGVEIWRSPGLSSLRIRDRDAPPEQAPLVEIRDLAVDYRLRPALPRYIQSLRAGEVVLHLDGLPPQATNYDFLLRRMRGDGTPGRDITPFIPQELDAATIRLEVRQPAWSLTLEGLGVRAALESLEDVDGTLRGDPARATWQVAEEEPQHIAGPVSLSVTRVGEELQAAGRIGLPELLDFQGRGTLGLETPAPFLIEVQDARLEAAFWPQLIGDALGIPLRFDAIHLANSQAAGHYPQTPFPLDSAAISAAIHGLSILGGEETAADPATQAPVSDSGALALNLTRDGEAYNFAAQLDLPEIAAFEGNGALRILPEGYALEASAARVSVLDPVVLERLTAALPGPTQLRLLDLQDVQVAGTWEAGAVQLSQARAEGRLEELVFGDPEQPWYQGDVTLKVRGAHEDGTELAGTLQLAAGDPLDFSFGMANEQVQVRAEVPDWSRETLMRNSPAQVRGVLETLDGVQEAGGSLGVRWQRPEYEIEADLRARLNGVAQPVPVRVAGGGGAPEALFAGELSASMGESRVSGTVRAESGEEFGAQLRLAGVDPNAWMQAWLERPLHANLRSTAEGALGITGTAAAYTLDLDLRLAGAAFGNFALPEGDVLDLRGPLRLQRDLQRATSPALNVAVADRLDLLVEDLGVDVGAARTAMRLRGDVDLGYAGDIAGLEDLWGEASIDIPTTLHPDGRIELGVSAQTDSMGYGDFSTPYNVPLHVEGLLNYLPESGRLEGAPLDIRLGEANQLHLESFVWRTGEAAQPRLEITRGQLRTDMALLVSRGYLGGAEGIATVEATDVRLQDDQWQGNFRPEIDAAVFALPQRLARLEDMHFEGDYQYDGTLAGTGTLSSESLLVGGVTLSDIHTTLLGKHHSVEFERLNSRLFDGDLLASGSVGILEEGMPVRLEAEITDGDLAVFTREFEPPAVTLTGRVSGTARVIFARDAGILDFAVHLVSSENFTLNRDMVEQLLLSHYVESATGVRRLDRVVQEVIGQAEQRPFESAEMQLGFVDGRISGQVLLKSRALNLTVDVTADPEALIEALKIRQEQAR